MSGESMKQFQIGSAVLFALFCGGAVWAGSDVVCNFENGNVKLTMKNFETCGSTIGAPEATLPLEWVQKSEDESLVKTESLNSKGSCVVGAGPGISGLPGATSMHFDFMRKGKVNRVAVYMCGEEADAKTYKAKLVTGEYDSEDPSNVKGSILSGRCDRAPLDASRIMMCTK